MGRVAQQNIVFDSETGEIIKDSVNYGTQNGDGWVIVYRDAYMQLALEANDATVFKVFASLMTKQEFEGGIKTTKKAIADELGITYRSIMRAFKWLKEHKYIKETKTNGQTEFLLNPNVTTCGKNKKAKIELWQSVE